MKTLLIEQVANGWIVRNQDPAFRECYKSVDIHVYRSAGELQADLPKLLSDELPKFDGVNEKSLDLIHHAKA